MSQPSSTAITAQAQASVRRNAATRPSPDMHVTSHIKL